MKKKPKKKLKAGNFQKIKATGFASIKVMLTATNKGTVPPQQAPQTTMKTPVYMWKFESSSSNKVYETLKYSDGSLSCDCPGWTRRAERTCKHTRAVQVGDADAMATKHGPLSGHVAPSDVTLPGNAIVVTPGVQQTTFEREFS